MLKLPEHFVEDWNSYVTMDVAKAQAADDVVLSRAQQTGGRAEYATALLSNPLTSADVERTFSLGTKLHTSTRPELQRCQLAV